MQWTSEKNKKKSVRTLKKIEVEGGRLVKKWEFGQTKKNLIYQFFKTRICAFVTYGQFPPKSSSIWDRSEIQGSKILSLTPAKASNP